MTDLPNEWSSRKLADLVDGKAPIVYGIVQAGPEYPGGVPYIKSADVGKSIHVCSLSLTSPSVAAKYQRSIVVPGDIVFSLRGNIGELSIVPDNLPCANLTQGTARIRPRKNVNNRFLAFALCSPALHMRIATVGKGSTFKEISLEELRKLEIRIPSYPVQKKLATILSEWDEAIERLESIIRSAHRQVSAVRQHLFEPIYRSKKGIVRARAVFEPVSEKARPELPLLAVMQDIGIVRRDELDRRVAMPDGETSGYKVVRPGDFVISLRSFEGGLELSNVLGLVSPAYTVLRPTRAICQNYFKHYFKSRSFIGRLDKMIFGVRDGKQIAFRDFGDMHIPCPSLEVQKSHAEILGTATKTIETARRLKTALERQKRGLMQKLLTGEWRVKL